MSDKRRIVDDHLYGHFITFSVYRRRQLLDLDQPKRIVLGVLNYVLEKHSAKCQGFVIMPNHVHALAWLPETGQLSRFMHEWKRQSSLKLRGWYRDQAPNYFSGFGEGVRFWQPKYYSRAIEEAQECKVKLDYMHLNPVKAGLVKKAIDWPWSSARWYHQHRSVGVPIEWIE